MNFVRTKKMGFAAVVFTLLLVGCAPPPPPTWDDSQPLRPVNREMFQQAVKEGAKDVQAE